MPDERLTRGSQDYEALLDAAIAAHNSGDFISAYRVGQQVLHEVCLRDKAGEPVQGETGVVFDPDKLPLDPREALLATLPAFYAQPARKDREASLWLPDHDQNN